ncbi:YajG family lipoprotein [Candidatus Nitrospira bockiana]
MKDAGHYLVGFIAGLLLAGCAAKGEVVPINLIPVVQTSAAKPEAHVAIETFEDTRPEQGRLGTRQHFWGGQSYFEIPGGKAGEAVAKAVHDYLKAKGWHVEMARSLDGVEKPDVVLSGKILTLSVDAQSKFMKTEIAAKTKIAIQAQNAADGSIVRMTLNGAGNENVFWFDPEDAQKLLNDVLVESLDKLVTDTKFENRLLRLKQ